MERESGVEFSLVVAAGNVPPAGTEIAFEANAAIREALARRYGILELRKLKGQARIKPYRKAGLSLDCTFEAEVVQSCVVTLDPVVQTISESFTQRYLPKHMIELEVPSAVAEREITVDAEAEDAPEPMSGSGIEVGEAVTEQLSLAIDPYPRKPEAVFNPSPVEPDNAPERAPNPFAALEKLKKNY